MNLRKEREDAQEASALTTRGNALLNNQGFTPQSKTLIFGAGGPAAHAWMLGVAYALLLEGVDLGSADRVIGTSAGALVGAQIQTAFDSGNLSAVLRGLAEQRTIDSPNPKVAREVNKQFTEARRIADIDMRRRRVIQITNHLALAGTTEFSQYLSGFLEGKSWPKRNLEIVAVDIKTGERKVFDRHSNISLKKALAASIGTPGIWHPTKHGEDYFGDGSLWSTENADLARHGKSVLVLAPIGTRGSPITARWLFEDIQALRDLNIRVKVVVPDCRLDNLVDDDPFPYQSADYAKLAGLCDGLSLASEVREFWNRAD